MISQFKVFCLVLAQLASPDISWGLPLQNSQIVRHYLAPLTQYSTGHRGVDFPAVIAEPIYSPTRGVVFFVGKVGYRRLITIQTEQGRLTLEPVCSSLQEGDEITRSEEIGTLCEPDPEYRWHCEFCLHLGLKSAAGYLSPELFIYGMTPSRLKP